MVIHSKLYKSNHIVAYVEIISESCDVSDENNLKKLYDLYHTIYNEINSLSGRTSHQSFSVKIFSNCILFMDEINYPDNDYNDNYPNHSLERSISLMFQFVSLFQAKALFMYGWLLKGFVTKGLLFRKQLREWRDEKQRFQRKYTSDIDFIWGEAQVHAYNNTKYSEYPVVFIDDNIVKDTNELFPNQSWIWIYRGLEVKQPIVNYGLTSLGRLNEEQFIKLFERMNYLIDNSKNDKIFKMFLWTVNYLVSIHIFLKSTNSFSTTINLLSEYNSNSTQLDLLQSYVLYIDMLGTKDKIKEEENEIGKIEKSNQWLNAINEIYATSLDMLNSYRKILKKQGMIFNFKFNIDNFKVKIFTDNILISYPYDKYDDGGFCLYALILFAGLFQAFALAKYHWMCHGILTLGDIYHDDVFFCGKVINDIESVEQSHPHLPRIIIDDKVYVMMKKQLGSLIITKDKCDDSGVNTFIVNYPSIFSQINHSENNRYFTNFIDEIYNHFMNCLYELDSYDGLYDENILCKIKHVICMCKKNRFLSST